MRHCSWMIATAGVLVLLTAPVGQGHASDVVPVNAGFETGTFAGWQTIGDATIQTSAFGTGPLSGTYQALITTGSGAVPVAALSEFLGFDVAIVDPGATEGSAIKQSIDVSGLSSPYEALANWVNILTNQAVSPAHDDVIFGWVTLVSGGNVFATLIASGGVSAYSFVSSGSPFDRETGFFGFGFGVSTGQAIDTFIVGFGVADVGDTSADSGLLIDARVPAPGTLLLLGTGLTALGTLAWRRRR